MDFGKAVDAFDIRHMVSEPQVILRVLFVRALLLNI